MSIDERDYRNDTRFGSDYFKVCNFLIRINEKKIITPNFLWARWTWMISRPVDKEEQRNVIAIWEDRGVMVALATFELCFGEVYVCIDPEYRFLFPEILVHVESHLSGENGLKISIADHDRDFQKLAKSRGYYPSQKKQIVSVLDTDNAIKYCLPRGFKITSMAEGWDFYQYNRVMWRGFNHEGEPEQSHEDIEWRKTMLSSPHLMPELVVAVVAPDGNYVSHCGLWHISGIDYAYVEPVATDPDYRGMGLGKASVLETIIRARRSGAKEAYVCSDQQFYYRLGFYPVHTETWWEKKLS